MTDPAPFPTPIDPDDIRLTHNLAQAVVLTQANAAKLVGTLGRGQAPAARNWPNLHRRVVDALRGDAPLPIEARVYLDPLLAWEAAAHGEANATQLAAQTAAYYAARGGAPASKMATLLQWAPQDRAVNALWASFHASPPKAGAHPRSHDWLADLPPGADVVKALAEAAVGHRHLDPALLPLPLGQDLLTPLASAAWAHSMQRHAAWWRGLGSGDIVWFLSLPPRAHRFVVPLGDLLLAPHARDLDGLRPAILGGKAITHVIAAIVDALPMAGHHRNVQALCKDAQSVIGLWRVLRDLEGFFASWGGARDRLDFWRKAADRVVDARWYPDSGWLALKVNRVWFLEHKTGLQQVWLVHEDRWIEVEPVLRSLPSGHILVLKRTLDSMRRKAPKGLRREGLTVHHGMPAILQAMNNGVVE